MGGRNNKCFIIDSPEAGHWTGGAVCMVNRCIRYGPREVGVCRVGVGVWGGCLYGMCVVCVNMVCIGVCGVLSVRYVCVVCNMVCVLCV